MALSYTNYTGDGSTTDYNVVWNYLDRDHVHVYVNDVEDTDFTWLSDSQIRMDTAPGNGLSVQVKRETPLTARLVNYTNGSTLDADNDLDADSNQLFFILQEGYDVQTDGQIEGPAGADGATILSGAGVPSDATGNNGDIYLRTSNGNMYLKAAGTWGSPIVDLTGPQGDPGADGEDGDVGPSGTTVTSYPGQFDVPEDGTTKIELYAPAAGTINRFTTQLVSGTCTSKLQINGVDVTGSSHGSTSTEAAGTCTAANTFVEGDTISIVISASATPITLSWSIKVTMANP